MSCPGAILEGLDIWQMVFKKKNKKFGSSVDLRSGSTNGRVVLLHNNNVIRLQEHHDVQIIKQAI